MSYRDELPDGWVRQFDERTNHPFWVDTKAKPPRPIWVHPYEDEQFLSEHPDIRERLAKTSDHLSDELPPPYTPRRHSYSGPSNSGPDVRDSVSQPASPAAGSSATNASQKHRGFFGKMKDKAIGTKEEREEAKRQEALYMQRRAEERRRQIEELRRQQRMAPPMYPNGGSGGYYQSTSPYGQQYGQQYYAAPYGDPYNRNGGYESYQRYGRRSQNNGFGNVGLPLLGGLVGGLILGDVLGGGLF